MSNQDARRQKAHNENWYFATPTFAFLYMMGCIAVGLIYVVFQWKFFRTVSDGLFVGLLLGATLLLLRGMRTIYGFFKTNIYSFFTYSLDKQDYGKIPLLSVEHCSYIFREMPMVIAGAVYGLAIASAVIVMDVWEAHLLMKVLLFVYLFTINFATGVGFYGMLKLFLCSWKLGTYVKVDLWQRENPTTLFFMKLKRKMALLATMYITMSITSIFFSKLRAESLSLGYSVFAGAIIILVFILPEIPIRKKLLIARKKALITVIDQLQGEFLKMGDETQRGKPAMDLEKIEKLILLKEKIEKVSMWPFGMQTASTVFSVLLITSLPILMEHLLRYLFE